MKENAHTKDQDLRAIVDKLAEEISALEDRLEMLQEWIEALECRMDGAENPS